MFKKTKIALGMVLGLASANAMAISVTTSNDATALANLILGAGITVSNATYSGSSTQSGGFTGDTVFGMGSGLVMTSGSATTAADTFNDSDGTSIDSGTGADADLSALISATTNNAAVLEFDFTFGDGSTGGDLFFKWAFASEEYNEYVDSQYNDVYAFFLDGSDAAHNIAKAPDGAVASINTINCGKPYNPAHVGDNCSSYNNNDLQDGGPLFATEYDGFTNVITASATGLSAGVHHIKIAIADTSDTALDSAVFIQGGTFSDKETVPAPGVLALLGLGLLGMVTRRRIKA